MRIALIGAAVAALFVSGTIAAARPAPVDLAGEFCGARYCSGSFAGAQVRATKRRVAVPRANGQKRAARALAAIGRHPDTSGGLSRGPGQPAPRAAGLLPGFLASFSAPAGSWCGAANLFRDFRATVARIVEPVRPGFVEVRSGSGARAVLAQGVAPRFVALIARLEATGYRIREMGGYAYRRIAGSRQLSKHAAGAALDINQLERDVVSVPMNRHQVSRLAASVGLCSGGDWFSDRRGPDLGHFEVCGRPDGARSRPDGARRHHHKRTRYAGVAPAVIGAGVDAARVP